jgi:hypothetical protein
VARRVEVEVCRSLTDGFHRDTAASGRVGGHSELPSTVASRRRKMDELVESLINPLRPYIEGRIVRIGASRALAP